ncbi:MAG: hypothetical protein ACYTDU_08955 [Planctomycetota bacterium]|jgi:hypothetical protein
MPRFALLLALLALVFAGCGKKKLPPPPPAASPAPTGNPAPVKAPTKRTAPAGIPQEFFDLFQANWSAIEKGGNEFSKKFTEAQTAQRAGDRAKMSLAIDEASKIYRVAKDSWAEIAYWPLNNLDDGKIDEKTHDRCENFLRKYGSTVTGWDKKAKALKEFSTVK